MKIEYPFLLIILLILTGCISQKPDLGITNGALSKCPDSPNCVSSMEIDQQCYIEPIITSGTIIDVEKQLLDIIIKYNNTNIILNKDHYIRVEFYSKVFHFIDDVEFYLKSIENGQIKIDVRSASRVGYSDLGVNRKRIEEIRRKFE